MADCCLAWQRKWTASPCAEDSCGHSLLVCQDRVTDSPKDLNHMCRNGSQNHQKQPSCDRIKTIENTILVSCISGRDQASPGKVSRGDGGCSWGGGGGGGGRADFTEMKLQQ